jgi:hypothetical protein
VIDNIPKIVEVFDLTSTLRELNSDAPFHEYKKVGLGIGYFLDVMRISMGDLGSIAAAEHLNSQGEIIAYWIIMLGCVFINCIIFMNFIVAEAGSIYNEVSENLEQIIQ